MRLSDRGSCLNSNGFLFNGFALPNSMQRALSTAVRRRKVARGYASSTKPVTAQPISIPTLDSSSNTPPAPLSATPTAKQGPTSIPVPTSNDSGSRLTLTAKTKAVVLHSPALGFDEASFPYVWLRDVCTAATSVDPSTKQKLFSTTDIKLDVKPRNIKVDEQTHELIIDWDRPLQTSTKLGDKDAQSRYKLDFLRAHADYESWRRRYRMEDIEGYEAWNEKSLCKVYSVGYNLC